MRHGVKGVRTYDFDALDEKLGNKFLRTLKVFHITPVEYNVEPCYGSWVRFLATEKQRLQIEYVFNRFVGFGRANYLRNGSNDRKLYGGDDIYVIY